MASGDGFMASFVDLLGFCGNEEVAVASDFCA